MITTIIWWYDEHLANDECFVVMTNLEKDLDPPTVHAQLKTVQTHLRRESLLRMKMKLVMRTAMVTITKMFSILFLWSQWWWFWPPDSLQLAKLHWLPLSGTFINTSFSCNARVSISISYKRGLVQTGNDEDTNCDDDGEPDVTMNEMMTNGVVSRFAPECDILI